ncbi:Thioredoxin-1 [Aquisphaera giovannonii]|uniref:Thioredoxin-1 n=1 Tax=Aquisphaera giovannonii TaxID=406548 RepID=A0A5B9WEN8_9BACT|nr:tetratricopeptide repeat protein [Aquisphaera giovannonii]QEH38933.1 Thioredoxin-1 [Aquisphaera giovannonii]
MSETSPAASAASPAEPHVIDVTTATFEQEVLERSMAVPVVIDFWAEWCGPCRSLTPVLKKLAREYEGKFVLAKVDIDANPEVAQSFGVRSIPAVFGVRGGQILDGFVGVQPENTIRAFLGRMLPSEAETLAIEAAGVEDVDPAAAAEKYARALALQPDLAEAAIGLARVDLAAGRLGEASARVAELEKRGYLEPEAERLKAELALRSQAKSSGGVEAARAALAANPKDLSLKFALAEALAAAGQYEDALALCLELVERDRRGVGEQARQTMVSIFQLLPTGDPRTIEYQRQLSLVL